jgi:hypothetical protein
MSATAPLTTPQPRLRPPARPRPSEYFGLARILKIAFGGLGLFAALGFVAAGMALASAIATQQDRDGYFTSATHRFQTDSYALTSDLAIGTQWPDRALGYAFDSVRIRARGVHAGKQLFLGIASTKDVDRYLSGVEHDEIAEYDADPFAVVYQRAPGDVPAAPPATQSFWQVQASGQGTLTIVWPIEEGDWSVVAMNADGGRAVAVEAELAGRAHSLWRLAVGLFVLGGLSLAGGSVLVYLGARNRAPRRKEKER